MKKLPNLKSNILTMLLIVSLIPLVFIGFGSWIVFGRILETKALVLQKALVEDHAQAIDTYLDERVNTLKMLASVLSLEDITARGKFERISGSLNDLDHAEFVDIGVISSRGEHLAYAGPYDLIDKNYQKEQWFKEVMRRGEYISDVFSGFRQIPHCIIAVKSPEAENPWVLRATINSKQFDHLVRTGIIGKTGDAFIINRTGIYQTTQHAGSVIVPSYFTVPDYFEGTQCRRHKQDGSRQLQTTTWLKSTNWLLVVVQNAVEVWAPVNRAVAMGALIVLIAMITIVITNVAATRHLTGRIERANRQREEMHKAFTRSAKLASIGELATGLAHEINNPLAIISADNTNIADIVSELDPGFKDRADLLESLDRCKRQVMRCKSITTKMLQFGRKNGSELKSVHVDGILREAAAMMKKQAEIRNIEIIIDTGDQLPPVMIDPVEFEQVTVNLINNSFQAMPDGGVIKIVARKTDAEIEVEISDNGAGISAENLERIFEPFFTTKPPGEGTGLGLSVCYGIVRSWGGRIEAESKSGAGTKMRISIPVKDHPDY